jgi:uncharacterized membrane protein
MIRRRLPVSALFLVAGTMHFVAPDANGRTIPGVLPEPRALVYASGVAELAGGAAVLHPRIAPRAGWLLVATLVGVFPANVEMALHPWRWPEVPPAALWARLPFQAALVAWVRWATRP